jgi:MYXO-CTERM domain-containing protein
MLECADGNICTKNDLCTSGTCMGTPVTCTPLDECHSAGTCDTATGVCTDPRKVDGSPCTNGSCQGGTCIQTGMPGTGGTGGAAGANTGGAGVAGSGASVGTAATGGGTSTGAVAGSSAQYNGAPFSRDAGGCKCQAVGRAGRRSDAIFGLGALFGAIGLRRRRTM